MENENKKYKEVKQYKNKEEILKYINENGIECCDKTEKE